MSSQSLQLYFVTLNCGLAFVDEKALGAHLFKPYKDGHNMPDIVVLSLQEIAPLAYCFIGQSWIEPYLAHVLAAVDYDKSRTKYRHVATHVAGMTGVIILGKDEIFGRITWIEKADVGVGLWEMGNKGAAAIRLGYSYDDLADEIGLTFVAAHLAAHEMDVRLRNRDWENIVRRLAFVPAQHHAGYRSIRSSSDGVDAEPLLAASTTRSTATSGMFTPQSVVFFGGDLNYRASDTRPDKDAYHNFPQPTSDSGDYQNFEISLAGDQLGRERRADRTLHKLAEVPIHFPPSYKYDLDYYKKADAQSRGGDHEPTTWHWAKHRVPSWCDRILFSSFLSEYPAAMEIQAYTILPIQPTTDHRPVALAMKINLDAAARACEQHKYATEMPFPLNAHAKDLRAAARTREFIVGIFAYLGTTWEGNGILLASVVGAISGWLVLRSFFA